jgi:hypothetical protein
MSPVLAGISSQAQAATLLGASILRDVRVSPFELPPPEIDEETGEESTEPRTLSNAGYLGAKAFFESSMGIDQRLQVVATKSTAFRQTRLPMTAVWDTLFNREPAAELDLRSLGNAAARGAPLVLQRMKDPWPKYLFSRNGRVVVHSRAGDFRELQEFGPGDEVKRIDWRASGKGEKLYVRSNQEDEQRDLTLVYDVELLLQGMDTWITHLNGRASQTKEKPYPYNPDDYKPPALMDLLTMLEFAAREDRTVNVVLYGRSFMGHLQEVVKSSNGGTGGRFDREDFLRKLSAPLQSAREVLFRERSLLGGKGFDPVNIFEDGELPFNPGKIYIFGLSKKNHEESVGVYRSLQRQGRLVAQIRKPREEE